MANSALSDAGLVRRQRAAEGLAAEGANELLPAGEVAGAARHDQGLAVGDDVDGQGFRGLEVARHAVRAQLDERGVVVEQVRERLARKVPGRAGGVAQQVADRVVVLCAGEQPQRRAQRHLRRARLGRRRIRRGGRGWRRGRLARHERDTEGERQSEGGRHREGRTLPAHSTPGQSLPEWLGKLARPASRVGRRCRWSPAFRQRTGRLRVPGWWDKRPRLVENRGVAQSGSASALGAEGRRFESGRPDTSE